VIPVGWWGQLRSRLCDAGGEATVKVCGVTVGDAAGVELGASLVDRMTVNAGTVDGRPPGRTSGLVRGRSVVD
jgi:hypothetical protein